MDITPTGKDAVTTPNTRNHTEAFLHMFESKHVKFPKFKHERHGPIVNVNEEVDERLTLGQKVADKVASGMGSWRFIIIQSFILVLWAVLNSVGWWSWKWDLYPFIAMNLLLSCQAAYAAPVIMMSQNRQAEKDRLTAQNDYNTDCKGEEEVRNIMDHLEHQDTVILQIMQRMEAQHEEVMYHLSRLDPELARRLGMEIREVSKEIIEEETGDSDNITGNS